MIGQKEYEFDHILVACSWKDSSSMNYLSLIRPFTSTKVPLKRHFGLVCMMLLTFQQENVMHVIFIHYCQFWMFPWNLGTLWGLLCCQSKRGPFDQSSQNVRSRQAAPRSPTRMNLRTYDFTPSLGTFSSEDVFPLRTFSSNNNSVIDWLGQAESVKHEVLATELAEMDINLITLFFAKTLCHLCLCCHISTMAVTF